MPTLDWIREAADDAYFEATASPVARRPVQSELQCPFCALAFVAAGPEDLGRLVAAHVAAAHPLRSPMILFCGRPIGATATITRLPPPGSLLVENATTASVVVDGVDLGTRPVETLPALICEAPRRVLSVRLANERSEDAAARTVEYRLYVDVAQDAELTTIEAAFLKHLAGGEPSREAVVAFADATSDLAAHYRDGLASYVFGVLAKDEAPTSISPGDALERALALLGRSAALLNDYADRPVAAAVSLCARFNLNDFAPAQVPTGLPLIEAWAGFFRDVGGAAGATPWPAPAPHIQADMQCPIDIETHRLIDVPTTWPKPSCLEEFVNAGHARLTREAMTTPDRVKLAVVLGELVSRGGLDADVSAATVLLRNNPEYAELVATWPMS